MGRHLRVYSDRSWLPTGRERAHVTMLCPFWGRNEHVGAAGWPDYADRLIESGRDFLALTGIADADLAVHPLPGRLLLKDAEGLERARAFADFARGAGRPFVFFFDHADTRAHVDPDARFPVDDAFVFRGSIFRSRRTRREFALPGFHDDLLAHIGRTLNIRRRRPKPVVSFCGAVVRPVEGRRRQPRALAGDLRRLVWRLQGRHEEDLFVRARAVDALLAQREVEPSVIVRESGGAGAWERFDADAWSRARREFVDNIVDGDYSLAPRGDGNWSIRLYESLCLGRIPVLVDTDCVLPYDFAIPWRDYCVWIDRDDVDHVGERVAAFHESITDAEFVNLQHECRKLWEQFLSPLGFFENFHRHFDLDEAGNEVADGRPLAAGA